MLNYLNEIAGQDPLLATEPGRRQRLHWLMQTFGEDKDYRTTARKKSDVVPTRPTFCPVRTDKTNKYQGISCYSTWKRPVTSTKPIKLIRNSLRDIFDNVVVPKHQIVGEPGRGWMSPTSVGP
jgi:alkylation response protein AidB-like acyl-CoA dehydrogenase